MSVFFGARLDYNMAVDETVSLGVTRRMLSAVSEVWQLVAVPDQLREMHKQQLEQYDRDFIYMLENPLEEEFWCPSESEDVDAWEKRFKARNYPEPYICFSPYAPIALNDYPNKWGRPAIEYQTADITIKVSGRIRMSDCPETWDDLTAYGIGRTPVVEFDESKVTFHSGAQEEVYLHLLEKFDPWQGKYNMEEYWLFNSRALAYVASAAWSAFPVKNLFPIYPGCYD